ncbi:hypothetical protein FFLO_04906 [Filobasidium floriforme]|uniref:Uncharacterized protein n=1 Tax=Filobasidium floriforme TaxID=5210 RepID=A0A8K0NPF3_9TREE|nr:hypothetical protein FFLO_04906 [Filobasidium floriforme]
MLYGPGVEFESPTAKWDQGDSTIDDRGQNRQPSSSGSSDLYHQGQDHDLQTQTHRDDKKDKKDNKEEPLTYTAEGDAQIILSGGQSPGVRRMEAINAHLKTWERWALFFGVFLVTYVYGLDGTVRYTYQGYATASYAQHSLLSTITVVRSVIGAAAQPTAAKISDVFGRTELILVSIVFYVVGTIVESVSDDVQTFCAGAVIYQIGYTMIILLVEVIIADLTSLRSRLFFSFVPALPFIINTWVSGDVSAAVLSDDPTQDGSWRPGIWMWAIIYPVSTIPLVAILVVAQYRAKRAGALESYRSPFQLLGWKRLLVSLFWQLDVIGIILIIAVFGLILTPLTLAGGTEDQSRWRDGDILAPLVVGVVCIPAWIVWEIKAPHPMIPFKLLKGRGVWAAFGIACTLNFSWGMQADYLYAVLQVAIGESVKSSQRIQSLYSFTSTITGTLLGLVVYKVRRLKWFILFGVCVWPVAMGLMVRYRGGESSYAGVIAGQVILGFAGGFFTYPTQASVQAETKHEHVAVVTGLYLATYQIGSALAASISGAIWTQTLKSRLTKELGSSSIADAVYADPYGSIVTYTWDTPERQAIVRAYQHVQRILCIVGLCVGFLLIFFGACLRDRKLGDEQSRPDAGKEIDSEEEA